MGKSLAVLIAGVACLLLSSGETRAVDRMLGVDPSDGAVELLRKFELTAGSVITGATFENNDATTVFPEVRLLRQGMGGLLEVASVEDVTESEPGIVTVTWPSAVAVEEPGEYFVSVRFPDGPTRQGPGSGPGIGAFDIEEPEDSYMSPGEDETLYEIVAELGIDLVLGSSKGASGLESSAREPGQVLTKLGLNLERSASSSIVMRVQLPRRSSAELSLYDVGGRRVRQIVRGRLEAGLHRYTWDGRDDRGQGVASGIYFARLVTEGQRGLSRRFVLVR